MVDGRRRLSLRLLLRNSDWQTIVARAPLDTPTDWHKYYDGAWSEPGLGGKATDIGFIGTGAGYLLQPGWLPQSRPIHGSAVCGCRYRRTRCRSSTSTSRCSRWTGPNGTGRRTPLSSPMWTILNPDDGSNAVDQRFLLSYIYVPPGKGFESRYLVQHEVSLTVEAEPAPVQVGMALTRWSDPERDNYVTSTGPQTDKLTYRRDAVVAYMLTRAPRVSRAPSSRSVPEARKAFRTRCWRRMVPARPRVCPRAHRGLALRGGTSGRGASLSLHR